ncbi:5-dehydro-4-deoxy-D-glucuronate isomerase [Cognatishimia maritima]|uniref:4-deoxy-L-threo-5-hexosulose-uronate ketol-isomerase n=1 Tax=Cognatishimia maritima TaxID=870908 RepID=A0A1M5LAV4_9RHOB|nr:5-dehydro-4-deoxy-D-glucuronate isomerase [Cognatishimia maritima]SHG62110.1 4-deoxy-L-threo-5-hexosulose-uronate ketol-isomerase [Cognatishimia maritima]
MDIRQACSPTETKSFGTKELRDNYLMEGLFKTAEVTMVYSHLDRTIVAGAVPTDAPLDLIAVDQLKSENFLDRREMGIINIGGPGSVEADGVVYEMSGSECLYLPMGTKDVSFASEEASTPAKFYFISTPAHHRYETRLLTQEDANHVHLGSQADANVRTILQYIHPDVCDSCQLVMGVTKIAEGSVWNTMPCHTHDRRSEVYLYFGMAEKTRVFHFMGDPEETRHLVVANEQAILSPGWSIHSGAGTGAYGFIWSMAGDNKEFTDMDFVAMETLR